ncbi:zf-CCHC domain-containing protein [Tanacetum coccineum]
MRLVVLRRTLEIAKNKKENYKSLALKVRQVLSDDDASSSDSNDEEYAMAVRDLKKFFRRRGKFVRQPYDDKKNFRKIKEDQRCFKCGDSNHFISDCPKNYYGDQKAFVVGRPAGWCHYQQTPACSIDRHRGVLMQSETRKKIGTT